MRTRILLVCSFMVPAIGAPGQVQAPRIEMTLAEALSRADSAPDAVVARAVQAVAESSIGVVGMPQNPSFSAATHTVTTQLALSLSVPFRWGGQRASALDVARADRDAAAADAGATVERAREAVTGAWFTLAANEQLEKLSGGRVERLQRTAAAVKDLFDAGRVARVDLVRAQAELAGARADVFTATAERKSASAALAQLVGIVPSSEVVTAGERPAPVAAPELAALLARVPNSAELRAAEARARAAQARVTKAKRDGLPALTLEGGADIDDPTNDGTDKHLSLGLSIPIGARASLRVSTADQERVAAERARLSKSIETEVVTRWYRSEAARQRLEALENAGLPAAGEAAELARLAYREGRLDLLRLLESERALLEVEANRIGTWVAWGTERAALERLVGGK